MQQQKIQKNIKHRKIRTRGMGREEDEEEEERKTEK